MIIYKNISVYFGRDNAEAFTEKPFSKAGIMSNSV